MNNLQTKPSEVKGKENKITMNFRLSKAHVDKLKGIADKADRPITQILEWAIDQYKYEKK